MADVKRINSSEERTLLRKGGEGEAVEREAVEGEAVEREGREKRWRERGGRSGGGRGEEEEKVRGR